ncbi:MAG TPA: pyridoxal-phosphate dependent enzyme, partial [Gemmatimonadaceae bacterium]
MHARNLTGTVLPLIRRYPALATVPRVVLSSGPTPVEHAPSVHPNLWIKRDDAFADPMGGNKARALEFLLGNVLPGDLLVTVGSEGSTHVLAVATYGRRLGAHVAVGRWRQVMNSTAARISALTASVADETP